MSETPIKMMTIPQNSFESIVLRIGVSEGKKLFGTTTNLVKGN